MTSDEANLIRRRRNLITAAVLGLVALGVFLAFIVATGLR